MSNRNSLLIIAFLLSGSIITGCAPDETPQAESAAAKRTVGKANNAATDAQKRVDEGNAVLDGK
ncbi:MAG: hypothetical protein H8F28_05170 [Fibrella sp.]|nr:hypothetical protein [Armatimonadota bacterium]